MPDVTANYGRFICFWEFSYKVRKSKNKQFGFFLKISDVKKKLFLFTSL